MTHCVYSSRGASLPHCVIGVAPPRDPLADRALGRRNEPDGRPEGEKSMSTRANVIDDGIDRIQAAFRSAEEEVQRLQTQFEKRTTQFNKETEKRVKRFRKDLRKNEAVQQVESRWSDVSKGFEKRRKEFGGQVETGLASVLGTFQIASSSDLKKLDKKLNRISRRLNALDKTLSGEDKAATAE